MKQKTIFVSALIGLLVAFVIAAFIYSSQKSGQLPVASREALIRMHSPAIGKSDAPVVIVEFFDPACHTCAEFYPLVKEMVRANPGKIRLVLRYAPFHNGSDQFVALLEAARKQGKFWPTLEALLQTQDHWAPNHQPRLELAGPVIDGLGLNIAQLQADMKLPEIDSVIRQDLADAKILNVTMTPEYFVNGRPLPSFGLDQLKELVSEELRAAKSNSTR